MKILNSATTVVALVSSILSGVNVLATPTPSTTCPSTATSTSASQPGNGNNVFGVTNKSSLASVAQIRGGELQEPSNSGEMDALVSSAALNGKLIVIDFTATWCGPCKMIAPIFKQLSQEFSGVIFVKVDVDEAPDVAAKYGVSAMPTFVFIKQGEVVDRLMGANPARLQELIQEYQIS